MSQRDIARDLARLREELAELGDEAPRVNRRSQALESSIAQLRADLLAMREAPLHPSAPDEPREQDVHPPDALNEPDSGQNSLSSSP